jgi:hypothetical protein
MQGKYAMHARLLLFACAGLALASAPAALGGSYSSPSFRSSPSFSRPAPAYRPAPPSYRPPAPAPKAAPAPKPPSAPAKPASAPAKPAVPPKASGSRPAAATAAKPASAKPAAQPSGSRLSGTGRSFTYRGREYQPLYSGDGNHLLWAVVWYTILTNGERQRHQIDCQHPQTADQRQVCDQARAQANR